MKKLLLTIIILLAMVGQGWATDYWACANANMDASDQWSTTPAGTSCACTAGAFVAWSSINGGAHNIYANGCTVALTDDTGDISLTKISSGQSGSGVIGGKFTFDVSTQNAITITANIEAGDDDGLSVSGAGAGSTTTELTIIGNLTGGSDTGDHGVTCTATSSRLIIGSEGTPATITGGTGSTASGLYVGGSNLSVVITGNAIGNVGPGITSAAITGTLTGNAQAGTGGTAAAGVYSSLSTSNWTLVGNIIDSTMAGGWSARPPQTWTVGNTYYHKNAAGAYLYVSTDPGVENVKSGTATYYIQGVAKDGTYIAGGGGGAWGF